MQIYGLNGIGQVADIPGAVAGGQKFKMQKDAIDEQKKLENTTWLAGAAKYGLDNWGQPGILEQLVEEGKRRGIIDPQTQAQGITKEGLIKIYQGAKTALGGERFEGVGPEDVPYAQRDIITGQVNRGPGQVSQPRTTGPLQQYDRYVEEWKAGMYPGTKLMGSLDFAKSIQQQAATGRAEGTASVVPAGERVAAATRLPRAVQAEEALANIKKADATINSKGVGPWGADGGPIEGRLLGLTEEAQMLDQAVNDAFQHVMALTRIPGVGAQSDWEGRLQMIPLPSITQHPNVRAQSIASLESLIADLTETANRVMAGDTRNLAPPQNNGGGASPQQNPSAGPRIVPGTTAINQQGQRIQWNGSQWILISE